MNYAKLAKEAYKLYAALRDETFDKDQATAITRLCVRDYPIFREMIEEEEESTPDEVLGYIHFKDGNKIPIISKTWDSKLDSLVVCTAEGTYRIGTARIHDPSVIMPYYAPIYFKHDGLDWCRVYDIDHVEYI